jgi:hypothetical protein
MILKHPVCFVNPTFPAKMPSWLFLLRQEFEALAVLILGE